MSDERHNGVSSNGTLAQLPPETEVVVRRKPRKFTPAFKVSFLKAAEACKKPGEIGVLLRREGLYYSTLAEWKRQRANGKWDGAAAKPGPKEAPNIREVARLKRENQKLTAQLDKAKTIIAIQKKLSKLLGLSLSVDEEL